MNLLKKYEEGIERSQQLRGDRSGAIGAEVGNAVASFGRIDEKEIYLFFDYTHKAYYCEAIHLRYNARPRRQVTRNTTD